MSLVVIQSEDLVSMINDAVESAVEKFLGSGATTAASEWLDAGGVAAMLHVHPRSVQKMVRAQGLPAHRFGPKLLRYRRDEVEAWIRDRRG